MNAMLDAQSLNYIEAARDAMALSFHLGRISREEKTLKRDIESLAEAIERMTNPTEEVDQPTSGEALYATPEGLGVIIHVLKK